MVSVRQARGLPVVSLFPHPASFRFHLAMDTLAFASSYIERGKIIQFTFGSLALNFASSSSVGM